MSFWRRNMFMLVAAGGTAAFVGLILWQTPITAVGWSGVIAVLVAAVAVLGALWLAQGVYQACAECLDVLAPDSRRQRVRLDDNIMASQLEEEEIIAGALHVFLRPLLVRVVWCAGGGWLVLVYVRYQDGEALVREMYQAVLLGPVGIAGMVLSGWLAVIALGLFMLCMGRWITQRATASGVAIVAALGQAVIALGSANMVLGGMSRAMGASSVWTEGGAAAAAGGGVVGMVCGLALLFVALPDQKKLAMQGSVLVGGAFIWLYLMQFWNWSEWVRNSGSSVYNIILGWSGTGVLNFVAIPGWVCLGQPAFRDMLIGGSMRYCAEQMSSFPLEWWRLPVVLGMQVLMICGLAVVAGLAVKRRREA